MKYFNKRKWFKLLMSLDFVVIAGAFRMSKDFPVLAEIMLTVAILAIFFAGVYLLDKRLEELTKEISDAQPDNKQGKSKLRVVIGKEEIAA